jgi:hypothetical protein
MRRARVGALCLALLSTTTLGVVTRAAAQQGPVLKLNGAEIQIAGRVQTQFNTSPVDSVPSSEMILRRVRLEATIRVNKVVSGKVQPDFAGDRVALKDAYLKLDFSPAFQLLTGKAYRPFSLLEQTSSTRILPIERGVAIRGLEAADELEIVHSLGYSDRDIGLQVMGAPTRAPLGLSYAAAVLAGPITHRTGHKETYQYSARATVRPVKSATVGASWSNRAFARGTTATGFDIQRGNAYEIDTEIGTYAPGFHLLGELTHGDYNALDNSTFTGEHVWLAYRTKAVSPAVTALEPILRASNSTISGADKERGGTLLTPGFNVYFSPLNRVMVNYDVWFPEAGGGSQRSFKAQFQLAF